MKIHKNKTAQTTVIDIPLGDCLWVCGELYMRVDTSEMFIPHAGETCIMNMQTGTVTTIRLLRQVEHEPSAFVDGLDT